MDPDQETVWQIVATIAVVALFVVGLAVLSQVFVTDVAVENEPTAGSLDGELENVEMQDGSVSGTFEGELDGQFEGNLSKDYIADVSGDIEGSATDSTVEGTINGTVSGPLDGTISGEINGTVDEEAGTFSGEFSGTVDGSTEKVSPDGGLALIGLIATFLIVMPITGYLIHRREFDD